MKFLGPDLLGRSPFGVLSVLLLPGLLVVGCVSLTKPDNVTRNCPTGSASSCSNNKDQQLPPDDAKKDMVVNPDQPNSDDTPTFKPDAGLDVPTFVPDSSPDKADSAADNKDTPSADSRNPADVTDVPPPPADQVNGAEPGPEPPAAEPGPEPQNGSEPGKEPGAEPGPELGPEPGPEPPADGGSDTTDSSSASCANATPLTGGNGTTGNFGTVGPYCFVTCDTFQNGWGCSNFSATTDPTVAATKRTLKVNGSPVTCGGTLPAKASGGYYYFELGAGGETWDAIWWSGTAAASCKAPTGGFVP